MSRPFLKRKSGKKQRDSWQCISVQYIEKQGNPNNFQSDRKVYSEAVTYVSRGTNSSLNEKQCFLANPTEGGLSVRQGERLHRIRYSFFNKLIDGLKNLEFYARISLLEKLRDEFKETNSKTQVDLHNQEIELLEKNINELKYKPIRRRSRKQKVLMF